MILHTGSCFSPGGRPLAVESVRVCLDKPGMTVKLGGFVSVALACDLGEYILCRRRKH